MLVSEAILRAEALEDLGAPGARAAYLDVSLLEERIAGLLPASTAEGAVARRGAVRASVASGDLTRARLLVDRYIAEPDVSDELAGQLLELLPGEHASGGAMDGCAPDADLVDKILLLHGDAELLAGTAWTYSGSGLRYGVSDEIVRALAS